MPALSVLIPDYSLVTRCVNGGVCWKNKDLLPRAFVHG